jgi:isopentenyl-diphosphate delta-isomerase
MSEPTSLRKDAHLDLCATREVEPRTNSTLLEHVTLVHDALPDLALRDIDLRTDFMGKPLRAPFLVTGMTGGSDRAAAVNRDIALAAERVGVAFGLGSQRAMSEQSGLARSYQVRDVAPTTVVLGNLGLAQARALGVSGCEALVQQTGADGLCLHLNVAQELTQPEGDRDFTGGLELIRALAARLADRLVVKETGCGISPAVALRLVEAGVRCVDVSGAGGTSWLRVEALRAEGAAADLGEEFAGWGIPTAAAVAGVAQAIGSRARIIAAGGIRTGLEAGKVLALGADLAGAALPIFRAQQAGGAAGAEAALTHLIEGLRRTLLLTGSRTVSELRLRPRVVGGPLREWLAAFAGSTRNAAPPAAGP